MLERVEHTVRSVLVANRGEIAVRIVRACRELGLRSIAVFSDADAGALHVRLADTAHRIGPAPTRESYLDVDGVLAAARDAGADAVHPGYGLLSEDARFAAAVVDDGLTWVGPPPEVIARMGDKVAAREAAQAAHVPVLPGGGVDDAAAVGFPLMVKATFGGGGRGMRVVRDAGGLDAAVASATREAGAAFGRGDVFVERHLDRPRHVEVQILADAHGTVLHLGDRDCTVQRRHQKLIEEAPAPALPDDLRVALHDAAVGLAREVGYVGAGTVEFLVDSAFGGNSGGGAPRGFWFLEMNTRLQVEHGVTELVTGVDLVAAQLAVAAGEKLWFGQDDVTVTGHAIQARIAAEDPAAGFLPGPGTVHALHVPTGPWVRCDLGVEAGDAVAAEYDSMFGKILTRGPDRDTARRRLSAALDELQVDGVPTTADYLRTVLDREDFVAVTHDTGSVERDWGPDPAVASRPAESRAASPPSTVSAPALSDTVSPGTPSPGPGSSGRWSPGTASTGTASTGHVASAAPMPTRRVRIATDRGPVDIAIPSADTRAARGDRAVTAGTGGQDTASPVAPMDATVVDVRVEVGVAVSAGDVLVVLEAMKMEIEILASASGTVTAVHVRTGSSVAAGTVLAEIEAEP